MATCVPTGLLVACAIVLAACGPSPDLADVDEMLDEWHRAAAAADAEGFFGAMTEDAIYLGTDATERWTRNELAAWAAPYFDRESAWDFTPVRRNVYHTGSENIAWFEEYLDTWMGTCLGSGVLRYTDDGWKIVHYHLGVTVPNERIDDFINLINRSESDAEHSS